MEETTDRWHFLKWVGVTLASGVGFAGFAGRANALPNCCRQPSSSPCDSSCPNDSFYCRCGGPGWDYCVCQSPSTPNCYNGPC